MGKKNYLFLFFLLIPISSIIYAQDSPNDYLDSINYIFANVDHSKVNTGLLSDYGLQVIAPEYYDGALRDSNEVDINAFRTLYADMDYSRFNNNCTLPIHDTVFNAIASNMPTNGQAVPITSMCLAYNSFRDDAYTAGLVTISNGQIFDVTGQNPYATKFLFAAAPLLINYSKSTISFILKSSLYYTNAGKTITEIDADMDDGNGFRNITWDSPFSITYTSSGNKTFILKFIFSDGSILQTHGKIVINSNINQKSAYGYYYSDAYSPSPNPFSANENNSGGTVTVRYGAGHSQIVKPLIIAEGFDPWKIIYPNQSDFNMTIDNFLDKLDQYSSSGHIHVPISADNNLRDYLYSQGYDIIYLDYNDGTDDIKRNANLFESVIKWVNANKQGSNPNVVLGISMGGLVARYALRQLETEGYDHQTKIYISFDSPHNGANVPVGAQAALYHAKDFGISFCFPFCASPVNVNVTIHPSDYVKEINQYISLLNTTAAKQMLIYKVSTTGSGSLCYDNSVHDSFMSEYKSMGLPQNCNNIALSDGDGTGTLLYSAGTNLINYSTSYSLSWWMDLLSNFLGSGFIFTSYPKLAVVTTLPGSTQIKAEVSINATPSSPGTVYHGRIYVHKKILGIFTVNVNITNQNFSSTSSMYPLDGAPGGIYDLSEFTDLSVFPQGVINQSRFCFVPAVSALALTNWQSYLTSNLNNYNFISNGQTNFQGYYCPMASNKLHTSFYSSDYSLANYIKTVLDNINSNCTSTTTIQNVNYTTNQTIEGCNLNIQNVNVENNSNVIFDATNETTINGPFTIQLGSSSQIK